MLAPKKPKSERLKGRAEKKMTKAQTLYGKADKIMKGGAPKEAVPPSKRGYGVMSSPPTAQDLALNKANDLYRRAANKEKRAKTLMSKSKTLSSKKK
jgi:hypothetical protein